MRGRALQTWMEQLCAPFVMATYLPQCGQWPLTILRM